MFFKVCGITRQEDANRAMELGFSAVGFILDETGESGESRLVTPRAASGIETDGIARVGVFVGNNSSFILDAAKQARLDLVQLHGDQTTDLVDILGRYLESDRLVRVIWPDRFDTVEEIARESRRWRTRCGAVLLDGGMFGGGHGEKLDLAITDSLEPALPWILAGGLDAGSVEEVARLPMDRRPAGMDFNSKLEKVKAVNESRQGGTFVVTHRGVKDHQKMAEVMDRARHLGLSADLRPPFVHSRTLLKAASA